jgi:hypothetical protein
VAPLPRPPYEIALIDEIPSTESDDRYGFQLAGQWKQIRHYFHMQEFSANAFVSTETGQEIVHEHAEGPNDDASDVGDEELYLLFRGSAAFKANGQSHEVAEGSLIFVGDPSVVRSITANEPGTIVLTFGTNPGVRFAVSRFEEEMSPEPRWTV